MVKCLYIIFVSQIIFNLAMISNLYAKTPVIKVRIADKRSIVNITGLDLAKKIHVTQKSLRYNGHKKIRFNCRSSQKFKKRKPVRLASFASPTKTVNFEDEKFKGIIHIQTSEHFNGCDIINETTLDDYLSTLLAKEMHTKWPIEALKAQAVAARSYALHKIRSKQVAKDKGFETYYDLENSEYHQVNGSFFDTTKKTHTAAFSTEGEVLTFNNKLVPIFFHSKCGGKTRLPEQVWSNSISGYQKVNCPFCHDHGKKNWTIKIPEHKLKSVLRKVSTPYDTNSNIRIMNDHLKSSQVKMYVDDNLTIVKKSKLRSVMGRKYLPSNYFLLTKSNKTYKAIGSGYGHGVGMCQFGAKELALQGYSYKQILNHYFPRLKLKKIY